MRTVARAVVAAAVAVLLGLSSIGAGAVVLETAFARPATAQEADRPPGEPCVPGASLPQPGEPPNGPSPVGRCEPSSKRRVVDSAVWILTLAALVGVVVVGVVLVRRDRRAGRTA